MFTTLATRLGRIAIPALVITGALATGRPALAADFCVGQFLCPAGVSQAPDLATALNWAALYPGADRIILSSGTFIAPDSNGWVYKSSDPVEITGVAMGQTILTAPGPVTQVLDLEGGAGTTIHDLSIQVPQMAANGTGLFTNATVKDVGFSELAPQAITHLGVSLIGDGTLDRSSVALNAGSQGYGVALGGSATVKYSTVSGSTAVTSVYGGTIERSWLTGHDYALMARGGTTTIDNSVVSVDSASGTGIAVRALGDPHPVVNADGLTIVSGFGGGHVGLDAEAYDVPGETATLDLKNSVLRGFDVPVEATSTGAGAATVATSWSDYDTSKTQTTGNATISKSNISDVGLPGFANPLAGNYHLASNSPLIDAGDPSETQGLDMDGNPSVTDGNLDGTARRDIGAYEVPGPLPADPSSGGQPQGGGSAGQSLPSGAAPTGTAAGSASPATMPPVVSGFRSTNGTFAVGSARTAIAAVRRGTTLRYSLSEAARVTIAIRVAPGGRTIGKLTRSGAKGANSVKFSGRIGRRALKPGRYVAVLIAADAAGNRSLPKQVTFRVVKR